MSDLTPRARVLQALAFEETDVVPYRIDISDAVATHLAKYPGMERLAGCIIDHMPRFPVEPRQEWIAPDVFRDDFGCVQRVGNIWHGEEYPLQSPSLRGYTFPDLIKTGCFDDAPAFLEAHKHQFTACTLNIMLDNRAWMLRGMENWLLDLEDHPAFAEELLDGLLDVHLRVIEGMVSYPFDCLRIADDWGDQRGLIMGAARWRRFIKPRMQKICRRGRELGFVIALHSCGGIAEIIPDLIDMGVQIINPFQPEAMNVLELKRQYGKHVCFDGGISTQHTLPLGSVDDVRTEVAACIRLLARGGGYIMSPAKPILADVPLQNAVALVEAIVHQHLVRSDHLADEDLAQALASVYRAYHV